VVGVVVLVVVLLVRRRRHRAVAGRQLGGTPGTGTPGQPAPGWFPDPARRFRLRWWDGTTWTAQVSDGGPAKNDPAG
jgi:hypothetical protein